MMRKKNVLTSYAQILSNFPNPISMFLCKVPVSNKKWVCTTMEKLLNLLSINSNIAFIKEIFGVYHIKIYLADNNIILTGANLNSEYLSNKQDRYILLEDVKEICDYFESALKIIGTYSYKFSAKNSILLPKNPDFFRLRDDLLKLSNNLDLEKEVDTQIKRRIEKKSNGDDCTLFAYFQCNRIKIQSEKQILTKVLSACDKKDTNLFIISPYMNIPEYISEMICKKVKDLNIVMGVPIKFRKECEKSNALDLIRTFALPRIYSNINHSLFIQLSKPGNTSTQLFKYVKPNFSLHFKGIYMFKQSRNQLRNSVDSLIFTTFGSSNYNYRSMNKDFECSFVLVPPENKEFENMFKKELSNIMQHSLEIKAPKITLRHFFFKQFIKYIKKYL